MAIVDHALLGQLTLPDVTAVTFYKRDEITTDLICCDVEIGDKIWTFHEELDGWERLIAHLEQLPNFKGDWFAAVSQPAFAPSVTVAFQRDEMPSRE